MGKFKQKKDRSRLGRGLQSLLGEAASQDSDVQRIVSITIDSIDPNPWQPRAKMNDEGLEELAHSIKEQGILQPCLVRPIPVDKGHNRAHEPRYQLVAGERRWRAAQKAGLSEVPVIVKDIDDNKSLEIAILENVQRENLNPVDTAKGYERLRQQFNYSHARIARRIGKSRMAVTNALRLLKLPEGVLQMLQNGALTSGHARALLGLDENQTLQGEIAAKVVSQKMSVRETERVVRELRQHDKLDSQLTKTKANSTLPGKKVHPLEKQLASLLQTNVSIRQSGGGTRLTITAKSMKKIEEVAQLLLNCHSVR